MKKIYLNPTDSRKSFYNKCYVTIDEQGNKTLTSYNTEVARITKEGKIERLWDGYSATTMRHINAFVDTFTDETGAGGKTWWDGLEVVRK